jgi:two-component system, response regulator YesN
MATRSYRISAALDYIKSHFADHALTIAVTADKVGLSPAYLSRLFRVSARCGFRQYLRSLRMSAAAEMLKDPSLRVKEIATAVGYLHTSSFDRDFRAHFGKNPEALRYSVCRAVHC